MELDQALTPKRVHDNPHTIAPTFPATCPMDHEGKWGKEERTRYNLSRLNKKTRHCRKRGIIRTLDPVEDASLKKTEEK